MSMLILMMVLVSNTFAASSEVIHLKAGFVHKLSCEGKLFISAIGNDAIVRLEALPKELGCGVILKPIVASGRTNLILETSTGSTERQVVIEGR